MNNLVYKVKNKLFKISKEARKIGRPSYEELIKYESFQREDDSQFILSFGAGRSGQNWFTKIFNSHPNWIGTCERFADIEAFYRYITYYDLPIDKNSIHKLFVLALKRDTANYKNSLIASPYLSFGIDELNKILDPDYLFFHIRDPIKSVESMYAKGWYKGEYMNKSGGLPTVDIKNDIKKSFSRVIPIGEFAEEWMKLTRIGKITWFWATINKRIYDSFEKIQGKEKLYLRLEDIDQNFEVYKRLADKFDFDEVMNKKNFFDVLNKAPNKGINKKYTYSEWSDQEKREFEDILNRFFNIYDDIRTNI